MKNALLKQMCFYMKNVILKQLQKFLYKNTSFIF